ncbi:MAG: hypothetical protein QGI83_23995 [Candidatus Latescibacteria bacterium]|jgi:hypothetical protein|nr:hypothetical protein [Candidatus Latescibacterota bacterium]
MSLDGVIVWWSSVKAGAVVASLLCLVCLPHLATARTYYASPEGGGDGLSAESAFRVGDFWGLAAPGDTLVLQNGLYRGEDSMLDPPKGLSGAPGRPIAIVAANDGEVEIDGEGTHNPVMLRDNDHFVFEGFNAHNAKQSVVTVWRGSHHTFRRICAWDAYDGNTNVFGAHHGDGILFEDCAGWGTARKTFSNAQQGNHVTFRRCWGRWEGSHCTGPKKTFALSYNSYHGLAENCIGAWNSMGMSETYELLDYRGRPYRDRGGGTYTGYTVRMPSGIFSHDDFDEGYEEVAHARFLGCIGYLREGERFHSSYKRWIGPYNLRLRGIEIRDCMAVIEPGSHDSITVIQLGDPKQAELNRAANLTLIGGQDPQVHEEWQAKGILRSVDGSELTRNGNHILDPRMSGFQTGAVIMKRYVDGRLTDEDLWPWPMNQRIIDGLIASGREPVDITRTVFEFCGGTMPDFDQ